MSFFFTKSKGLKFGFLMKRGFPRDKGGASSIKDKVTSLLLNDEDLHEEWVSKMLLCLHCHLKQALVRFQ
jgi:hypothetical protein